MVKQGTFVVAESLLSVADGRAEAAHREGSPWRDVEAMERGLEHSYKDAAESVRGGG